MGAPSPSPDDSGVVSVGSVLDGRYRIDSVLGTGGMGRVYKGEHTGIGKAVAIKVLHAKLGGSREATQRFQREALASGRLDHPNIVGVSDFGVLEDGSLFLVMEALEGETLGQRLEREKRIPWPEAVQIISSVLAGLRHAHAKNVVHRDIKPDNVFLANKDGERVIKILDFGIAKLVAGDANDPASTRAGLTVGTPAYLSPEQAVGGEIKPATDLYSLSIVFYEMLTGRTPFDDKDPLAMLTAHVSRDIPSFAEVAPDLRVPPGLEQVIQKGLAKISDERFTSANEYADAIQQVLAAAGFQVAMMPRASGQMIIPTPPPDSLTFTPPSGTRVTKPPVGVQSVGHAATMAIDRSEPVHRPSGIADAGPIPRKWIAAAFVIVLGAAAIAIYLLATRSSGKSTASPVVVPVPVGGVSSVNKETRLKAALHDLETGKTCADRKEAVAQLAALGDPAAIPALKRARYRGTGGVLGIGESNANACLRADAEKAIQDLSSK
jgi:serine/threonine protein kinase